ncbi:SRPBCC domain-containing protein [Limibacter armeniacum]|uniref:SRPBCC family protein n=1 Tax=Limibacter armeniacum TaxID=466084 RepID=UPI002FE62C2E
MQRTIKLKKVLPYTPDVVWKALTDSNFLGQWFMENDLVPEVGREFTFRMAPQKGWDGITHCQVIELEPLKKISYTYRGEATGEKAMACAGIHSDTVDRAAKGIFAKLDTVLSFTLEPTCGGTILQMEHSGYRGFKMVLVSLIMTMGWKKQLGKKLPKLLEKLSDRKISVS